MDDLFGMLYNDLPPARKLLTVVTSNMVDSLAKLLADGIDPNSRLQQHNGNTALHISCDKGHHGCVRRLLLAGAHSDLENEFGYWPIHLALRQGNVECVRLLINHGGPSSDPMIIWQSQTLSEESTWLAYSSEMAKLLLKATPDFRILSSSIRSQFYSKYLENIPDKELVKLYFLTGNLVNKDRFRRLLAAADQDMKAWLTNMQQVQSLQLYARNEIRKYLKPNVYVGAKNLPLPQKIKQFLLLDEEE